MSNEAKIDSYIFILWCRTLKPSLLTTPNEDLKNFIEGSRCHRQPCYPAISLFSGAGLSDAGYESAGFQFLVHSELSEPRAALGKDNYPEGHWIVGDIRDTYQEIVSSYQVQTSERLCLLAATPPCQGMSSSNPTRGKRSTGVAEAVQLKNELILSLIPIAQTLKPRLIVCENVRQLLSLPIAWGHEAKRVIEIFREELKDYHFFESSINVADYGVPQDRRRAIIVGIERNEKALRFILSQKKHPWPAPTHSEDSTSHLKEWISVRKWMESQKYPPLDSATKQSAWSSHLHQVPTYSPERYAMIASIPPHSGRNAYMNDSCLKCDEKSIPSGLALCPNCQTAMTNRPIVWENGVARLVKGFKSSYRRMHSDFPAATITTNSSHIGSDYKIHPWENRVLSTLECADLQTVPRWYSWKRAFESDRSYMIRQVVGEAFPPYFTYLHGLLLSDLLADNLESLNMQDAITSKLGHRRVSAR